MKDKTQILPQAQSVIGRYVRIVKHRRGLGEFGTVHDWFWREDEPWVVLRLPSGSRVAVAVSWTDLPQDACLTRGNFPEVLSAGLGELAKFLQHMEFYHQEAPSRPRHKKKARK